MAKIFACFVLLALIVSCALGQAPSSAPTKSPPSFNPTPAPKTNSISDTPGSSPTSPTSAAALNRVTVAGSAVAVVFAALLI
ncbi:hypothetical protein Goshw_010308 [Gossypium schwendimanii]|uniref:Uncharacterized protein n=1 Tax=Gossypium schwendimanii TaxID=34291 RepID=A0A7J9KR91_GOSSC|nr:hypothetical protein [Gossypium schwendimanii]